MSAIVFHVTTQFNSRCDAVVSLVWRLPYDPGADLVQVRTFAFRAPVFFARGLGSFR
jgi:hypothetical protein